MKFEEFCRDVLIVMTTFNRKKVTEICLRNMEETKGEATLWVVDDHSSEYGMEHLQMIAPNAVVMQFPEALGIEKLRFAIQKAALKTSYRYIYHTDNDAYHDPNWLRRLYDISMHHSGLIGLYNTKTHIHYTISGTQDFVIRNACPGISFFFEQSLLKDIPEDIPPGYFTWDFVFGDQILPAAISTTSYVEHFGADGIHSSDFETERSHNPTPWLQAERVRILQILRAPNE